MKVKSLLIGVFSLIALGMWVGSNYAEIDPQTIVAIWTFDEGKGDIAGDFSGNGHDGKIPDKVKWVTGKFDTALEFDGSAMVEVEHHDDLNLETYSLVAWVKAPEPPGKWSGVIIKRNPGHAGHYGFWVSPDGRVHHAHMTGPGAENQVIESKTSVADGKWHHVAGTYDLKVSSVYIDGILEGTATHSDKPAVTEHPLTIGGDINDFNLPGVIDEAGVFSVALSEGDIKDIMNQGLLRTLAVDASEKLAVTWASIKVQDR